ncbi:DNA repair endonuclease XPF [Anopheles ziemanni]|uniref:DNA repair endonuclease XPF n=1 Tax=Anopheles ziemanni TaxID=345580 RepID=UPI00265A8794|nr:DNA repair endonuclease XPF isoform X1 [Anopheles coustani]XP_058171795.1 DNA repair endonuclease XPF [Anopheles ziemanni]
MSLEDDDLDAALACSADQAENEANKAEAGKEDATLTQLVDAEEFLATEGVPLLEYEKQMFLDLLLTDALVVCAKGISYERVMLNLLKIFCDNSTLVLVVNCSESEEQYYKTNLEQTEHIHESAKLSTERERTYLQGGIQFISTRILVVDLLKNRIPIELITGVFVVRAHEIIESCQEAFALRLYRQRNKVGFVKAFSRNVEAFTYGYGHVEKVMRNLFVKELFIWPRFHMTIQRSLKPFEPAAVEIQIPMTQNMILLQTHLLDLMNYLVKSIKSLNRFVELQEVTVENCVTKKFHKILQAQLDTIWHQLSSQTKLIVADLKVLRSLMISCLYGDSVSFYALLKRYRTTEYALNNSGWTILDAAEKVFTLAKERVYNRENEFEPELCPKWKALSDVLRVDIPNEIKEAGKKIRKKEERQKFLQQQVKILILCQDPRACYQLSQFLTQGPQRYLFYQALKNDISVAKLSENFKHIPDEVDMASFQIREFEPVTKPPVKATHMGPPADVAGTSKDSGTTAKGGFLRERIAKKRLEVAEAEEARKRKEKEEEELGPEGDREEAKKSDMEKELAATAAARKEEEADYQRYFRDSYVLTMSQKMPEDALDKASELDVSVLESGVFEPFTEMENMDITTVVKDCQRPLVFIQTFRSESNGLGSLDRTLEQIHPRYIVMYHTNVTAIRQIEVYEARQQRKEMARVRVYAIIHSKTVEEQSYLTSLRREKQAFELLIETKRTMVVPEYQDGKSEDTILMLQKKQELSSRQAGGQEAKDTGEIVTPRVIVDMREFRSDLPCLIHRRGIDVVPLTITIGDYIITPEICVERKSISDLIGSLNSGRLYNQCVQMTRYYAKPILLIEFDQNKPFHFQRYFMVSGSGGGGSSSSAGSYNEDIMAKLQLLTIHFPKLRLVWSPSPYSTAQLFEELKQGKAEPDPEVAVRLGSDETAGDEQDMAADTGLLLNVDVQEFLTKLPGITARNVGKIMRRCQNLRELTQKSEAELEELLGGQALAKQLWEILHVVHKPAQPDANDKPYSAKFRRGGRKM